MTPDELAALQALADRADRTPWAFSNETRAAALAIRPLLDALDAETARADAAEQTIRMMAVDLARRYAERDEARAEVERLNRMLTEGNADGYGWKPRALAAEDALDRVRSLADTIEAEIAPWLGDGENVVHRIRRAIDGVQPPLDADETAGQDRRTTIDAITHGPCCSSHGKALTCAQYRRTHFVEVRPCCEHDAHALDGAS